MTHHEPMTADILNGAAPGSPGRDWVAALPAELAGQRAILDRLLDFCAADSRARWLVIGCSLGRGAADRLSDLDLAIGVAGGPDAGDADGGDADAGNAGDAGFEAACTAVWRAVDGLGDLVESFRHQLPGVTGPHTRIFAQFADRCQVDLVVRPAQVDPGSIPGVVVLHDRDGQVTVRDSPAAPVPPGQIREWAFLGWCAVADLGKYLRRGSPWEARGRLEEARAELWKLQAAAGQVAQPQYGLTSILDFAPGRVAPEMAATVADLEPAALLAAAQQVARLLSGAGAGLDAAQRAALPAAMARYITADLAELAGPDERAGPDTGAPARA
jgi:hypothetical protein